LHAFVTVKYILLLTGMHLI